MKLDENEIVKLAQQGATNEDIAEELGVSADTLERRYAGTLKKGRCRLSKQLRRRQVQVALSKENGHVTMLIWLGKQLLGQKDVPEGSDQGADAIKRILAQGLGLEGNAEVPPEPLDGSDEEPPSRVN